MLGMLREPDPGRKHLEEVFGGERSPGWQGWSATGSSKMNLPNHFLDMVVFFGFWMIFHCYVCQLCFQMQVSPRWLQSNCASSRDSGCSKTVHQNHMRWPCDFLHECRQVCGKCLEEGRMFLSGFALMVFGAAPHRFDVLIFCLERHPLQVLDQGPLKAQLQSMNWSHPNSMSRSVSVTTLLPFFCRGVMRA